MKKVIVLVAVCFGLVSCEKNYRYCLKCTEINPPTWANPNYSFCDIDKKSAETGKKNKEAGQQITDGPNNDVRTAYYTCDISVYVKK